jgi:serine/threonine protein kinase
VTLEIDSLLKDRYRILKKLAQSGMGTIYLAHDEVLNVHIAIKENLYTTEGHSRQFRQEATILAKLRHPNLPRVIDHFVMPGVGEYLVMDYIEGQDLDERLESLDAPMPEDEIVQMGAVVCEALSYLHSRTPPVIHRDIKPANIKLTPDGHVVLVDFGLAKFYAQGEMTATGAQGITPGYSPVEQYGQGTDARSDIYALGATLYTLLTAERPPEALERALGTDGIRPIVSLNPDVSPGVAAVVRKAMAVQAEDRYESADALQEALLAAHPLPDFSPSKPVIPAKAAAAPSVEAQAAATEAVESPSEPRKRARVWLWLVPVVLVLAAVATGVVFIFGDGLFSSPDPTPVSPATETPAVVSVLPSETPSLTVLPPTPTSTDLPSTATPTETQPPAPQATPQGGGAGQIAFVSERSGEPQIYLLTLGEEAVEQLTFEAEGACQPDWSPDGRDLAFISPCSGRKDRYDNASIFVLHLETGVTDLISTLATGDYDPDWSPDGTRLAFTSLQTGKPQIFLYDLASRTSEILMDRATISRMPEWSPDGTQILFISPSPVDNRPTLFVVDAAGEENPKGVQGPNWPEAYRPAWSPQGDLIVFDLGTQSLIGGRLLSSNQDVPINTAINFPESLAFSSDSQWLVCDGVLDRPGRDIFLMTRTGVRLTRLTEDPAEEYQPAWRPAQAE